MTRPHSKPLTTPVHRSIKLPMADGGFLTFDVAMTTDGVYMRGPSDRVFRGPMWWSQCYLEACKQPTPRKPADAQRRKGER